MDSEIEKFKKRLELQVEAEGFEESREREYNEFIQGRAWKISTILIPVSEVESD